MKKIVLIVFGVLFLAVVPLIVIINVAHSFTAPRSYVAQARILVNDDSFAEPGSVEIINGVSAGQNYVDFHRQLIMSKPVLAKVAANLDLSRRWGEDQNEDGAPISMRQAIDILRAKVAVEPYRNTGIISLKVKSTEPDETARIANELAAVYRDSLLKKSENEVGRGLVALKRELEKQKERVDDAEVRVEKLRHESLQEEIKKAQEAGSAKGVKEALPLNRARREMEVQRSILNALQNRVVQEGIEMEIPRTPVEMIDPAETPEYPSADNPNIYRSLLVALITVPIAVVIGIVLLIFGIRQGG